MTLPQYIIDSLLEEYDVPDEKDEDVTELINFLYRLGLDGVCTDLTLPLPETLTIYGIRAIKISL